MSKVGLDDYLLEEGPEGFEELLKEAQRPEKPEWNSWWPWWKQGERGGVRLLPGVLSDILAETPEAAENWKRWEDKGKPVEHVQAEIKSVTGGASIIFVAGEFYVYRPARPGVWGGVDRKVVEGWVTKIIGTESARLAGVRDVVELLQALAYRESDILNGEDGFLNLRNGFLNLDTFTLEPHRKDVYSTIQIDIEFDKKADCPRFQRFIDEVIVDEQMQPDRPAQAVLQEFVGYVLTTDTRFEKTLLFEGPGANGKSVLLKILEMLVGPENVSSVPLERLDDQFRLAELHGKLLNLAAEVATRGGRTINADIFKQVVSGDLIQAAKKYRPPFDFHPVAKHVFAMNTLPRIYDTSLGFWRRILVIRFGRVFTEKEQDRNLVTKLEKELPGILNWALVGLAALREQGRFTQAPSVAAVTEAFRRESNPVSAFVDECCEVGDPEWSVTSAILYQAYREWAEDNGIKPLASNWFGRDLGRHDRRISPTKVGNVRMWYQIRLF